MIFHFGLTEAIVNWIGKFKAGLGVLATKTFGLLVGIDAVVLIG